MEFEKNVISNASANEKRFLQMTHLVSLNLKKQNEVLRSRSGVTSNK